MHLVWPVSRLALFVFFSFDSFFSFIIFLVGLLFRVAWITLLERKILGGIQLRKGPNYGSIKGMLQPIFDFLKLLQRCTSPPRSSHYRLFAFSPLLSVVLSLSVILVLPVLSPLIWGGLFFFLLSSFHLYPLIRAAWSSNRVYAILCVSRAGVLALSYEIPLLTFCLGVGIQLGCLDFQSYYRLAAFFYSIFFFFIFLLLFLAESHRLPFDFVEAERELVSGYNVEYGGWGFALLIVAEYSRLILVGQVAALFFFGAFSSFSRLFGCFIRLIFLSMRGALPRFCWQHFLILCWTTWLPFSFFHFVLGILLFKAIYKQVSKHLELEEGQ